MRPYHLRFNSKLTKSCKLYRVAGATQISGHITVFGWALNSLHHTAMNEVS